MASAVVGDENVVDNSVVKPGEEDVLKPSNGDTTQPESGKRKRTAVQAYVPFYNAVPEKKELEFEAGSGVLLGEIDIVAEWMKSTKSDQYTHLHRICYSRQGDANSRKKNLRKFNGFPFDKDSKEYAYKLTQLKKIKKADRTVICKVLGLKQSTTIEELLEYLMCPTDSGKHKPVKGGKKKSATPKKTDKKKSPTKKKKKKSDAVKPSKVSKVYSDLSDSISSSEEEEEEEEPAEKKQKTAELPSEEELTKSVESVVADIDLETVSMKQAVAKVFALYPLLDLAPKKTFVKDAIRKLIESRSEA